MLLAQIEAEKKQAVAKAYEITNKAEADGRILSDEERATVKEHLAKAEELDAKLKDNKSDSDMRARLEQFRSAAPARTEEAKVDGRRVIAGTYGQQITASVIGEAIRAGHFNRGARFNSPVVELRAETLTTTVGQAGAGALVLPDERSGILPILFQAPTVRSLIGSGTTRSNTYRYRVETLATNNAAVVPEAGLKPQSVLRFDDVTETDKKIATYVKVSQETLEDVDQMQSYIDARLRTFIAQEFDDQILNGSGVGDNFLGLRNRAGLTAPYSQTGDDNAMDAVHKQITQIIINSFTMPDGIVMNPLDWEAIVLSKEDGATGAYIGANPFMPLQQRTLWGLPVVITQAITAGVALVGAFRTQAQFFSRTGLRVSFSNSNEDDFIHNLVTILAEERGILAVYRPPAFGKVFFESGESA